MYDDPLFKLKPFDVVMMSGKTVVGKIFLKLTYEPASKQEESKEVRFIIPEGTTVNLADIPEDSNGNFADLPSLPIHIPDILEEDDGDFQ